MIREMRHDDITDVVEIYMNHMYDSFFVKLGRDFLSVIFDSLVGAESGLAYVYEDAGRILGFIMATTDAEQLFKKVVKDKKKRLFSIILGHLVRRPGYAVQVLDCLFYSKKTQLKGVKAEFLFISVVPACRGRNLSKELVQKVLDRFQNLSIQKAKVTIKQSNYIAKNLLEGFGFNEAGSFSLHGKENLVYEFLLADAS